MFHLLNSTPAGGGRFPPIIESMQNGKRRDSGERRACAEQLGNQARLSGVYGYRRQARLKDCVEAMDMARFYGALLLLLFILSYAWERPPAYPLEGPATPTAVKTATAFTVVPLSPDVPDDCPVTRPPEPPFEPPGRPVEVFKGRFWYGSDELFLALPLDGTWGQLARGEKVFWWSVNYPGGQEEWRPEMTVRARRLMETSDFGNRGLLEKSDVLVRGATNASHATFPRTAMLHGLTLPSSGCWEITGAYKGAELSFVVWVP